MSLVSSLRRLLAAIVTFGFVAGSATGLHAKGAAYTPADFAGDNQLVKITIAAKDIPEKMDNVMIQCQGFVLADGALKDYNCIAPDLTRHQPFLDAVVNAIPRQKFKPATANNGIVRVFMNFGVLFTCKESACQAIPMRNHAYHLKEFGLAYIEPQPILPDDNWYAGFEKKLDWTRKGRMPVMATTRGTQVSNRTSRKVATLMVAPVSYVIAVDVDADGGTKNATIISATQAPRSDAEEPRALAEQALPGFAAASFVPAFHGGKPVPMRLTEYGIVYAPPPFGRGPTLGGPMRASMGGPPPATESDKSESADTGGDPE